MWDEKAMYDYIHMFKRNNKNASSAFRGNSGNLNSLQEVKNEIIRLQKANNTANPNQRKINNNNIKKYQNQIKNYHNINKQNEYNDNQLRRSVNNPLNNLNNLNRMNNIDTNINNAPNAQNGYGYNNQNRYGFNQNRPRFNN